ncbi:MAG: hypothetical protein ACE5KM_13070 [Planctomycetaceae bacterium]
MLAAIRPYLPKPAQRMVAAGAVRVKFNGHYDWSLNDQRTKPRNDRAGR